MTLDKEWALVLGVSSGMGRAAARGLATAGMNLVGVHLDTAAAQPGIDALTDELAGHGVEVHLVNGNAASARTRGEVIARLTELAGDRGVRVVLHSLAFGSLVPYLPDDGTPGLTAKQMDMTLNVMAHSLVYWCQDLHGTGLLRDGAKVFAMTSEGATKVTASYGAVSAAKSALESHVRQLAFELAPSGVAVNALCAGVTLTPALERIPEHATIVEKARGRNPHGRLTTPEDVATALVGLAGLGTSWVTGNVLGVDGGESLRV